MEDLAYQALNGLVRASYLWMIAAGLSIGFGVLGILNMAHGALYMIGAYLAFTFCQRVGLPFVPTIVLSVIAVGGIGFGLEKFALRPIYRRPLEIQLILTFGLLYIITDVTWLIWKSLMFVPALPGFLEGFAPIGSRGYPIYSLFLIGAGIAIYFVIQGILGGTWWGRTMRAAAADREMANAIGINIRTLFATAFVFASALAALGGAITMNMRLCTTGLGAAVIVPAFVVVAIGTLGNIKGAFIAAIIIGVVSSIGTLYLPFMDLVAMYIIMTAILVVRPAGLFGRAA